MGFDRIVNVTDRERYNIIHILYEHTLYGGHEQSRDSRVKERKNERGRETEINAS